MRPREGVEGKGIAREQMWEGEDGLFVDYNGHLISKKTY